MVSLEVIQKISYFSDLSPELKQFLAESFSEKSYAKDAVIIKQGDAGDGFYVIKEGTVVVEIDGERVARLSDGQFFGEIALITSEPRTATIIVASEGAKILYLTREAFDNLKPKMPKEIQVEIMRRIRENVQRSRDQFYI